MSSSNSVEQNMLIFFSFENVRFLCRPTDDDIDRIILVHITSIIIIIMCDCSSSSSWGLRD